MMVGAAEDVGRTQDYAFAKTEMDKAKLAGLDSIRVTQTWTKGQTKLGPTDAIMLDNAVNAAQFTGLRVVLSLYPFGSSVTPLTDDERADFAAFAADIANRYPRRPRLHRRQRAEPQSLLAAAVRPGRQRRRRARIRAAARRGLRRAESSSPPRHGLRRRARPARRRQAEHRPRHALADGVHRRPRRRLPGERASDADHGRVRLPPYPETSARARTSRTRTARRSGSRTTRSSSASSAPRSTERRSVARLCRSSTTSSGSRRRSRPQGAALHRHRAGDDEAGRRDDAGADLPAGDADDLLPADGARAAALPRAGRAGSSAWQSGEFYVDGTPKTSLSRVAQRRIQRAARRRRVVPWPAADAEAGCPLGKPTKTGMKVLLTCSLDCIYTVRLDGGR